MTLSKSFDRIALPVIAVFVMSATAGLLVLTFAEAGELSDHNETSTTLSKIIKNKHDTNNTIIGKMARPQKPASKDKRLSSVRGNPTGSNYKVAFAPLVNLGECCDQKL